MIGEAQRLNPGIEFSVGSMTDLAVADNGVGGVCAWYSTIHVPDDHLPRVFDEFHRVLIPGGFVLLGFQVGDEPRILDEAFGQRVELTFFRRQPGHVLALWSARDCSPTPNWSANPPTAHTNPPSRPSSSPGNQDDDQPSSRLSLRNRFMASIFSSVLDAGPV